MGYRDGFGRSARHTYGDAPAKSHRLRIYLVLGGFILALLAIGAGLVKLQADPNMKLTEEEERHVGQRRLEIPRGDICDRNGRLLAKDRKVGSLWADPRYVQEPSTTALHVSVLLHLDEDQVLARLSKRDAQNRRRKFVWIKRWLTDQELEAFEALSPAVKEGLAIRTESVRFYPEGQLAAHVLGFANRDGEGCEGVERAYDSYLRSIPGRHKSRVDAHRKILSSLTLEYVAPKGGDTVYTTIDKNIQRTLEQQLESGMARAEAPRGMGLVMDPKTGAILALACRPAFDPNRYWEAEPELYGNRAAIDVFEPGSSFKIVTASATLEHGLITPDTLIDCEGGAFNPYGHRIRDFHKMDVVPFTACFTESSNIAIIKVAAMLGEERLETWIRRFSFGRRACQDLLVESRGIFRPRSQWSRLSMGSLPMGQEIAVTIFQLARAFSVIANGGCLVEPHLVERVVSRDGAVTYERPYMEPERILSERTAATMKQLCHLVALHGTGKYASIPEFRVGGKTGTAQIARPDGKGFYPDKYTAIFAGFAPIRDPQVCAVIVIQEPGIRLHYGGYVCGPVFKEVVRDALIKLNCPQDPVIEESTEGQAAKVALAPSSADDGEEADADTVMARTEVEARGTVVESADGILGGLELVALDAALTLDEAPALPSFAGLTKRQAKARIDELGLNWDPQGAGWVVLQDPPAGTSLVDVTLCRLVFSNRPVAAAHETDTDS